MSKRHSSKIMPHLFPPVKRRPAKKRKFRKIFAAIRGRNQPASTATAGDLEAEDRGLRISRGFTIIFGFHIVAIGLYFVHLNYLNDHTEAPPPPAAAPSTAANKPRTQSGAPLIAPNDKTCKVQAGDNYARIASREGVDEDALRAANGDRPLSADLTLILPQKRHTAGYPPAVEALRNPVPEVIPRAELVDAVPVDSPGILVRPKIVRETINTPRSATTAGGRSYVVKSGDSVWGISQRFDVDQKALMKANGISDAKKLQLGKVLTIP
jgi:LysM repeat protein